MIMRLVEVCAGRWWHEDHHVMWRVGGQARNSPGGLGVQSRVFSKFNYQIITHRAKSILAVLSASRNPARIIRSPSAPRP